MINIDDMERDELLIRIDTKMDNMEKKTNLIASKIYGNGNQGLAADVASNCATIKNIKWFIGIGFTALGLLIAVFNIG